MPNTQTSVPTFTAGQVLTAQQMTEVNTGIPVFATTTTRDAAFGGTGEKALAEGQMAYIENIAGSSAVQYYDGAAWQTLVVGGLTLIKTQTIGTTVSSVEVTGAFSSTYDTYKIVISGGATSGICNWRLQLGATTTGYYYAGRYQDFSGAGQGAIQGSNVASWVVGTGSTSGNFMNVEVNGPNLADETTFSTLFADVLNNGSGISSSGNLFNTTSYTAFTLFPSTGTATGGTIRVYGYANS